MATGLKREGRGGELTREILVFFGELLWFTSNWSFIFRGHFKLIFFLTVWFRSVYRLCLYQYNNQAIIRRTHAPQKPYHNMISHIYGHSTNCNFLYGKLLHVILGDYLLQEILHARSWQLDDESNYQANWQKKNAWSLAINF